MRRVLALILLLAPVAAYSATDWRPAYSKGAEALDRGEPREAVAQFRQALALAPDSPEVLQGLVLAEFAAGQAAAAGEAGTRLLHLVETKGSNFAMLLSVGQALAKHGQFSASMEFLKVAQRNAPARINGRDSAAFFEDIFASLSARMQKDRDAVEHLQRLVESEPGDPTHRYELGLLLIKTADFPRAYEVLRQGVEKFPGSVEVRLGYALAAYFSGRNDEAEQSYRQIIRMQPRSAEAYFALGNFYADTGRDEDAVAAFRHAVQMAAGNYLYEYMYGVELFRTGNVESAATYLGLATRHNPRHADSQYWLGRIYLRQNQPDRALECFEKTVSLEPKHIGAYYQLGLLYKRRGDEEKARQAFETRAQLTRQLHEGVVAERMAPSEPPQSR